MSLELESNGHQNNLKEVKAISSQIYEFEEFALDASHLMLRRGGEDLPMTPKQVETLLALVERGGEIISKDDLMNRLWPDAFVEESNLIQNIHILRKTLGETSSGKPMIETLRRRGYRFNGEVKSGDPRITTPDPPKEAAAIFKFPTIVPDLRISDNAIPAGALSKNKLFAAATVVLLLATALFYFYPRPTVGGEKRSIAVLPVKPVNASQTDEVYQTGIAESLINTLGSMKGFIVRPLSSTRRYSDIEQDPIAAGREQKVDYILASNYQIADGKIRITSQLFNIATGEIDETYKSEKEVADVFAMQDAIASQLGNNIARFFGVTIGQAGNRGTTSEEAYRLYLQGAALTDKRTTEEVRKAIEYFEQAVALDPNYALAYARLANARTAAGQTGTGNLQEEYPKAKASIEKALALDPNLAEAHSYLAEIKCDYEWDYDGAERENKRAIELNPNSPVPHRVFSLLLSYLGRHDESIAESKMAIDLEPASLLNHLILGRNLMFARRYDEAIAELQRTVEMDPTYFFAQGSLGMAYNLKGDDDRWFESLMKSWTISGVDADEINSWKAIYSKSGARGINERQFAEEKEKEIGGKPNYNQLAGLAINLGHRDEAFDYLEKSIVQRRSLAVLLKVHPRFDPFRDDPRFDELLKRVGFE